MIDQRRLRLVEVANIMFGRVLRTAPVQQFPHPTLEFHRVVAFADNIILMKYMTEKMSIIELMDDRTLDFIGQRFEPVRLVPSKCRIECYNIPAQSVLSLSWVLKILRPATQPITMSITPSSSRLSGRTSLIAGRSTAATPTSTMRFSKGNGQHGRREPNGAGRPCSHDDPSKDIKAKGPGESGQYKRGIGEN